MRKVLSFVLVLSLVLSSFSMAFAAAPATSAGLTDIEGVANQEAIQVNYDLGIITGNPDGTFLPEKAVNRAEFAAMITRALAIPESALAGYTSTTFKDTVGYGWAVPYLAFCQSKGIMIGDGYGNVMPGRTINVNEAMTMVLRAVGYTENSSLLVGTWPSKYVTVAQNLSLYDDVDSAVNVDKANAAQIIYNALTVQKVAVNSDGETAYLTVWIDGDEYPATLLNTGLDSLSVEEIVVYEEDSLINLSKYIGAWADVYRDDGGEGDIIAVEMISDFLTGEYNPDTLEFEAYNGTDYSLTYDVAKDVVPYFLNGREDGTVSLEDYVEFETLTIAVDLSGKTIDEVYSIGEWVVDDAVVATTADIEDLEDQEFAGHEFTLDDYDAIDLTSFMLVGAATLEEIATDDVVYIYLDADNDEITKLAVGTDVINEEMVTEDDDGDYTIGGKVHGLGENLGDYDVENFDVGDIINARLDAYGDIFTLEVTEGTPDMYGIIEKFDNQGINDTQVRLYTLDDATIVFNVDDEATSFSDLDDSDENSLMGYSLDKDGVIDAIDLNVKTPEDATLSSISVLRTSDGTYAVASDVVVFTKIGTTSFDYDITTIANVETGVELTGDYTLQMILDEDDYVVAMVINDDLAGVSDDENYAVINRNVRALDSDNDPIQKLTGFMDGAAVTVYTDDTGVVDFDVTTIALWELELDGSGIVTKGTEKTTDAAIYDVEITDLNSDKSAVKIDTIWYALADNAKVYEVEDIDDSSVVEYEYDLSSVGSLRDGYKITLFETDDDFDGYDVIIFEKI